MEIKLQGHSIYGIPDWDGTVEVNSLKLFQAKRLSGSRNLLSLFRKFLKIFKGQHSPLKLPEKIKAEDLTCLMRTEYYFKTPMWFRRSFYRWSRWGFSC